MTQESEELARENRIAVVLDICSSTAILEDLLQTNNEKAWRDLLLGMKQFLTEKEHEGDFKIYKFVGDGWVLLFPEHWTGGALVTLLQQLSDWFDTLFATYVQPQLQAIHQPKGLTFGVDAGQLVRIEMNEATEYIGRPLNVAARLQAGLKNDQAPAYKALFTNVAFNKLYPTVVPTLAERSSIPLKNIRGGQPIQVVTLPLRRVDEAPIVVDRPEPISRASAGRGYELQNHFNRDKLGALLSEFRKAAKRPIDVALADRIEADLLTTARPTVRPATLKQLARWCNTSNPLYSDGMEVARDISMLLFGKIVDREKLRT